LAPGDRNPRFESNPCAHGVHEQHVDGRWRCLECGEPAGSTLNTEPYDYPQARAELETVHAWLRKHGLEQSAGDGQWGYKDSWPVDEWNEVGNTVQAIEWVGRIEFERGVYTETPK